MATKKITIEAPSGLHARPAGDLVKLVKTFAGTEVTLATEAKTVKAASMLSVLSLGLKKGTEVEIAANGPEEAAAVEAVAGLLEGLSD